MKFVPGKTDTISTPLFVLTKYLLSMLSIVLTIAFVFMLETQV